MRNQVSIIEKQLVTQLVLIEPQLRNMSVVYSVKGSLITFCLARSDGHVFSIPTYAPVALDAELEKKFIEIADLFAGY